MGSTLSIVCSDEPRNGKTLFARLITDMLSLSGAKNFRVFDTDIPEGGLAGYFPGNSQLLDLNQTGGQVQLFDTILKEPHYDYVVDLDAGLLGRFFKIFADIGFDKGLLEAGVHPSIYFILDRKVSSVAAAKTVFNLCGDVDFIAVRNEAIGNVLALPQAALIYNDIKKAREIILPRLSIDALNFADGPEFSFADFLTSNGGNTPNEIRFELWSFLESFYNQKSR